MERAPPLVARLPLVVAFLVRLELDATFGGGPRDVRGGESRVRLRESSCERIRRARASAADDSARVVDRSATFARIRAASARLAAAAAVAVAHDAASFACATRASETARRAKSTT